MTENSRAQTESEPPVSAPESELAGAADDDSSGNAAPVSPAPRGDSLGFVVPDSVTAAVPDSLGAHSIFRFLWIYGRRGPDATGMSPDSLSSRFGSAPPPSSSGVPGTKGSSTSGAASEEGRVGADEVDADGTGAFGASAPADSLDGSGAPVPVDSLLQRDRKPGLGALDPLFEIDPAMVEESTERRPREMLPWLSTLRVQPSGAYHTPDPIGWGDLPGRERVAVLLDGSSVAPPAFAETAPDPLDPVWTNSITVRRASPLRLPNEPAGGPLLEYELIRPESLVVLSGVRLTDGSAVANTDAIYLARPTPKTVTHVMWADHKAGGRIEYGSEDGQDLLLRHERSTRWGRWALGVQNHDARQRVFQAEDVFRPSARWLWDRSAYTALVEGRVHGWSFRGDGEVSWHRYAWEGTDHAAKRKDGVERALLRLQGPGARWSPRLSAQVERHRWRYHQPGRLSFDRTHTGVGLAAGVGGVSNGWRYEASVGRADPGSGGAGASLGVEAQRTIAETDVDLYLGTGPRVRVLPRLSNHLGVMVGQTVSYPDAAVDPPGERVSEAEVRLVRRGGTRGGALTARVTQIGDAVLAGAPLADFTPASYLDASGERAETGTIRVLSLTLTGVQTLRWGFEAEGTGWLRTMDPGWRKQLWATPAEMQGVLSWDVHLFQEGFRVRAFGRGQWSSSRNTPEGSVPPQVRFDGGATAGVGPFRIYAIFVNLANTMDDSATYVVNPMPQALRSYRMGLTWRFFD